MKQTLIFAIVVLMNTFLSASTTPFISASNDKVFILNLGASNKEAKTVKILDVEGNVVFTESVKGNITSKKYNLTQLASGSYTFIVENSQKIAQQSVTVSKKSVAITPFINETYKPDVKNNKGIWTVNALVLGKETKISLLDYAGNTLLNESFNGKNTINRAYNTEKLESGKYIVNITVGNQEFAYTLEK